MPEGFDHDARSIDTDRRNQDWQVQTCGTECSKPFAATLVGTDQADRLKKRRLYIHLYRGRAIFLTRCAWAIPASLFRVCADPLDRDGVGARPHTRHGQLSSTPLTASVLRDIEGGVPVKADHILADLLRRAGVAADNRSLVRIANAHAKSLRGTAGAQSGGGRKRGIIITPPRAAHVRSRAQHKSAKAAAIASLISSLCWAGGKSRDRGSFACARRKLLTRKPAGLSKGHPGDF